MSDDSSYTYDADLVRVIDGDTVVLRLSKEFYQDVDFGFRIRDRMVLRKSTEMPFRLFGINTPEVHGDSKTRGEKAKAELERLLRKGPIVATTYKADKYGRWLVELKVQVLGENGSTREWIDVNKALVDGGFAKPYFGGKKEPD
jgi:endonuclease YncB( thermonuclease family)